MTVLIDQATQLRSLAAGTAPPPKQSAGAPKTSPPISAPVSLEVMPARPLSAAPPASLKPRKHASVIAITSGKGGVGKTNVAVNLAIRFAAAGKEVVLLDADLGLANADVLCNVDLPSNLSHFIARRKELRDVIVKAPGGFNLVGGASGLARMADLTESDRQRLIEAMEEMEGQNDIILIDTGAGISPSVLTFTRAADHVLVVTTPEPPAITDAYAVIKVVSRQLAESGSKAPVSLLVNQARSPGEGRAVYDRISKVARQFLSVAVLDAGFVLADEQVPASVRRRMPFLLASPRCPASQCIAQLAMRLERGVGRRSDPGLVDRISRWFRK